MPDPAPKRFRLGAVLLVFLAVGGVSLWFGLRRTQTPPSAENGPTTTETEPAPAPASAAKEPSVARDQPDIAAAPGDESHKPGDHSHPITPERLKIYRENGFMGTIHNAIQVKDYAAVRRMNAEYRKEYPKDSYVVQDAYDMIADCLEQKTPERVERARKFWETRRSSRARRDIRHICLE